MDTLFQAIFLGIIEGLTEFLPVSSTGHLILVGELLGFEGPPGKTFEIVIQLGAIAAVCVIYFNRLWRAATGMFSDPAEMAFVRNILIGFLPAMVIGAFAYKYVRALLDSPMVIAVALIVGGFVFLWLERVSKKTRYQSIEDFDTKLALKIGLFQCIAMIPGVSRSGATIMGSLMLGVERKTAAEYSFFLAIPTMLGATVFSLYKNWDVLSFDNGQVILAGFVAAFIAALFVVRAAIAFIGKYGFVPFAYYRIIVGSIMVVVLQYL